MKRITVILSLIFIFQSAIAQELLSKKGFPILPEPNDWSIGFGATPILKYVGNLFNHAENNNVLMDYQDSLMIVGLYVKNPTTAYRGRVRLSFSLEKWTAHVPDQLNVLATVNDERNYSQFAITLGFGIQKSRGKGRLKGIYGFEGLITYSSSKNEYTYGNAIDDTHQTPLSTDWTDSLHQDNSNPSPANLESSSGLIRATALKNGSFFGIGARGFIGAEYFFAPKMSLSAEYGWSILFGTQGEGEVSAETWNGSTTASATVQTGKKLVFDSDVDHDGGMLVFHVYF